MMQVFAAILLLLSLLVPHHTASGRNLVLPENGVPLPGKNVTFPTLFCSPGSTARSKDRSLYLNSQNTSSTTTASRTCSLGYYCHHGTCQCRKAPEGIVKCGGEGVEVLGCYCATPGTNTDTVEVGTCIFGCGGFGHNLTYGVYNQLDENLCEPLKRTGTLCGRCLPGHYPLAYSFDMSCIPCPHVRWNWVRYIMAAYLPLTLFFIVIVFLKINVVSGHLHPVVLFCQGLSMAPMARGVLLGMRSKPNLLASSKVVFSLYGIWNFDFFRPFYSDFCLGIGILPTLALDYAIAVYPLLLMIISYLLIVLYGRNYRVVTIMWRPFQVLFSLSKNNWDVGTSVIDAFSTFFLLSNVKFLSVSFDLLVPTRVYHLHGDTYNYTLGLYYAADIEYFGSEHLPYAILAIVLLCVFVILPTFILALYPFKFFQKFLNLFPGRWYILHTFVDSFQGCYKDGTELGTRDYRWFSALYLSCRSFFMILFGATRNGLYFSLSSIVLLFIILFLVVIQPYKHRVAFHYKTNSAFLILFALFYVVMSAIDVANSVAINFASFLFLIVFLLAWIPVLFFMVCVLYWVFSRCKCCLGLVNRLRWWRRGYVAVGGDDDAEADSYCDRAVNPQAYPTALPGRLAECSQSWNSNN